MMTMHICSCGKSLHHLGIARHRTMHRERREIYSLIKKSGIIEGVKRYIQLNKGGVKQAYFVCKKIQSGELI